MNGINPLLAAAVGSLLRFGLGTLFGVLVEKHIWTEAEASAYLTAAVPALIGIGWALYKNYRSRQKLVTALATPHATSEAHVEQMVSQGQAPPASLPKTQTPYLNPGNGR